MSTFIVARNYCKLIKGYIFIYIEPDLSCVRLFPLSKHRVYSEVPIKLIKFFPHSKIISTLETYPYILIYIYIYFPKNKKIKSRPPVVTCRPATPTSQKKILNNKNHFFESALNLAINWSNRVCFSVSSRIAGCALP